MAKAVLDLQCVCVSICYDQGFAGSARVGGCERDAISLIWCGFVMTKALLDLQGLGFGKVTLLA